jgi:hypothetical protein
LVPKGLDITQLPEDPTRSHSIHSTKLNTNALDTISSAQNSAQIPHTTSNYVTKPCLNIAPLPKRSTRSSTPTNISQTASPRGSLHVSTAAEYEYDQTGADSNLHTISRLTQPTSNITTPQQVSPSTHPLSTISGQLSIITKDPQIVTEPTHTSSAAPQRPMSTSLPTSSDTQYLPPLESTTAQPVVDITVPENLMLTPELRQAIDQVFFCFLARVCSDPKATDSCGDMMYDPGHLFKLLKSPAL